MSLKEQRKKDGLPKMDKMVDKLTEKELADIEAKFRNLFYDLQGNRITILEIKSINWLLDSMTKLINELKCQINIKIPTARDCCYRYIKTDEDLGGDSCTCSYACKLKGGGPCSPGGESDIIPEDDEGYKNWLSNRKTQLQLKMEWLDNELERVNKD